MTVPATLDIVAVVGNGLIGHGMAQIFAAAGHRVVMIGRREESLAAATDRIAKSLAAFEAHGLVTSVEVSATLGRIRVSTELEVAADAQLILEAVPADRAIQDEVYGRLDAICAPPAVFASGSGQPASELVSNVTHRGRVVAAHFWYPPQLIPLVEVCAGPESDPDVAPWLCDVPPGSRKGAGDRRQGGSGLHWQPASVRDPARSLGTVGGGGGVGRGDRHGGEGVHRAASRDHRTHRVGRHRGPRYAARVWSVPHPAPEDGFPTRFGGYRAGRCGASRPALGVGECTTGALATALLCSRNARRSCSVTSPGTRASVHHRPPPRMRALRRG